MGTEKFIAFKEDGSAYRLKGRILRFLDNEPVSEADKTNIRSTLSVPASAEGLTPANNLSDLDNAATARSNLSVNSIDEDAEATGTKLVGPALYFRGAGPNDYLEVADDAKLSFTDGTDDLPFSISAWVKMGDATQFAVISKYGTTVANKEWFFGTGSGDTLSLIVIDTSGNFERVQSDAALTGYEGQWIHVAASYAGAGPSAASGNAFTSAADGMTLYVNGQAVPSTEASSGTYTGMSDTSQAVCVGRYLSNYAKGHIKDVKIFNRELTADEVAQLARGTDLGFSSEWGGALGGVYTQDATPSGEFSASGGADSDLAGPLVGKSNVLRFTADSSTGTHRTYPTSSLLTVGKRYRISGFVHIPSGQSNIDGFRVVIGTNPAANIVAQYDNPTLDAWTYFSGEALGASDGRVYIFASDGGATSFTDAGGDDTFEVAEITVTETGKLAEFCGEDFNESAGKLLDRSDNNFVAVNNGATLTGKRRHISAATLDLTNLPTSSAGLSAGEVWNNSGVLTIA